MSSLISKACGITRSWILRPSTTLCYSTEPKKKKTESSSQKQMLMKLRKDTGFPLFKCKQALINSDYDFDGALEQLKINAAKEGWDKMEKVSDREASKGLVTAHRIGNHAAMLEINCESDFVARTSQFQNFVGKVTIAVLKHYSESQQQIDLTTDDILPLSVQGKKAATVNDTLAQLVGNLGENIIVKRGVVTSLEDDGKHFLGIHTHPDISTPNKGGALPLMGHYAAIVGMRTTAIEPQGPVWLRAKGRDLAQHIIGMSPLTIGDRVVTAPVNEDLPQSEKNLIERETSETKKEENLEEEFDEINESEFLKESMFDDVGELSYSDELLQQSFLLDANITVQNWLDINRLDVDFFLRYRLGSN